ncbi:Uncharacterised protein [Candidatus Venteria ishoeyi]|uniref:Uncharacterized protein n=1 Tax=Candidatus Venteria ishoeyi TaxID=1899563 RepID=A0A1H6F5N3_9GAMM|nr:Uncharacterised protein [Candidatus Venteria ishoeyi]
MVTVVEGVLCLLLSTIIHALKIGVILQARAGIAGTKQFFETKIGKWTNVLIGDTHTFLHKKTDNITVMLSVNVFARQ